MKSVFASDLAIAVLASLEQCPAGLALAPLARAAGAPLSATQTAVALLTATGLLVADADTRPRYRIGQGGEDPARHLVAAALGLGHTPALDAGLRANPGVEFASRDATGLVVVTRFDVAEADHARLADLLARGRAQAVCYRHDDLKRADQATATARARALAGTVVTGTVARSFPDPSRGHDATGLPLGRLHPGLPTVSAAAIARVAREFGLKELRIVGSAVCEGFGPGDDVEVAVRYRHGQPVDAGPGLRRALEDLFDRDVVVRDVSSQLADKQEDPGVTLHGSRRRGHDMLDQRLVDIAGAVPSTGLEAAWAGIAEIDRVPPPLRTGDPDGGYSRLASPGQLRTGVRRLYAVRLARRDPARYRKLTQVGLRFVLDALDPRMFSAYVAWLDELEGRYPGKLDALVAAYRETSPPEPSWMPGFAEIVGAYERRAADLDR